MQGSITIMTPAMIYIYIYVVHILHQKYCKTKTRRPLQQTGSLSFACATEYIFAVGVGPHIPCIVSTRISLVVWFGLVLDTFVPSLDFSSRSESVKSTVVCTLYLNCLTF